MPSEFKRPSKIVLYLAREKYRPLDGLLIFGTGYAFDNLYVGLAVMGASLLANTAINLKMRSYR